MKKLLELYFTFLKIGSVAFGGGYAMLPILQKEFVVNRSWVTDEELMDYFAIGQCTPGIIAVNVSTFIGNKQKGILGAIVSTLGFVTVPISLILIIAAFLKNFADLEIVNHAFAGIRVAVCVLILNAVERLWKKSIINNIAFGLFLVIFALTIFTDISPAIFVILAGITGILLGGKYV
ncbi:MAG: chromate transporter [Bacilli bacterium]|nr:chromate transporter [Bacilli bacterium]